jgi:AbrB family looped-hinge helix DNA binding protein
VTEEREVKVNSKGQVTIPADLRRRHGFVEGDEVQVIDDGDAVRIVHVQPARSRGARTVSRLRGRATTNLTTDELMELLRGD